MCVCVCRGDGGGGGGPGHIPKFTRSTHFRTLRKGEQPLVEVLLYVHRNRRFNYQGRGPRTSTSTFTQPLSSDVVNNLHHNNKCSGGGEIAPRVLRNGLFQPSERTQSQGQCPQKQLLRKQLSSKTIYPSSYARPASPRCPHIFWLMLQYGI